MSRSWLDDKDILIISRPLAKAVGINGSIVLRRVQYWLDYNENHKRKTAATHFHDGRWWAMNGYQGWTNDLEIMSYSTVRRTFTHLENLRLLVSSSKYNRSPNDQTKWWTIDYDHYEAFVALWMHCGSPICRDGNEQTPEYKSFIACWRQYLALESVIDFCRTLLTVDRVEEADDPAHGEQGTLLTVNRVEDETLLTVNRHPAHGEHTYPRESSESDNYRESRRTDADRRGRQYTADAAGVFQAIDENLKQQMTPMLSDEVNDALKEFGAEAVLEAVRIANLAGKQWPYARGTLENWRKEGRLNRDTSALDYAAWASTPVDLSPVTDAPVPTVPADFEVEYDAWRIAVDQMALQLDSMNYDHVKDARLVAVEVVPKVGTRRFVIGCRTAYQRDRLQHALLRTIRRILHDCYGNSNFELVFELIQQGQHENAPVGPGRGAAVSAPPPQ